MSTTIDRMSDEEADLYLSDLEDVRALSDLALMREAKFYGIREITDRTKLEYAVARAWDGQ